MNRLLLTASKSAAPSLHAARAAPPSLAVRSLSLPARRFSDSADGGGEIRKGEVTFFSYQQNYGFIVPDGADRDNRSDVCFVHRNDIVRSEGIEKEGFWPGLHRGQRVAFKVTPALEGKESPRAVEVTSEGGKPVPPFRDNFLKSYVRSQKARFGEVVFDVFTTSQDQKELEEKIVAAFDETKRNIDQTTERVERAQELTGEGQEQDGAQLRDEPGDAAR